MVVGVTCGAVVVGRSRGGGCGMKKEGVSQFVMRVTLDQRSNAHARDHAPTQMCSVHYMYNFVVFIIQSFRFPLRLCSVRFFTTKICSVCFLALQNS